MAQLWLFLLLASLAHFLKALTVILMLPKLLHPHLCQPFEIKLYPDIVITDFSFSSRFEWVMCWVGVYRIYIHDFEQCNCQINNTKHTCMQTLLLHTTFCLNNVTKKKNKMNVRVAFVLKFRKENPAFLWCTLLPSLKLRILCSWV